MEKGEEVSKNQRTRLGWLVVVAPGMTPAAVGFITSDFVAAGRREESN